MPRRRASSARRRRDARECSLGIGCASYDADLDWPTMPVRSLPASLVLALGGVGIVILLAIAVTSDAADGFDRAVIDLVRADGLAIPLAPLRWITELGS